MVKDCLAICHLYLKTIFNSNLEFTNNSEDSAEWGQVEEGIHKVDYLRSGVPKRMRRLVNPDAMSGATPG
jgi:hypothetical protein